MKIVLEKEHEWLGRLVGEWSYEAEAATGSDAPPERSTGREIVRSLGGLWIVGQGEGEIAGGGIGETILTLGYDTVRGRFAGTFIGTMMSYLWVYDGELDPAGNALTLNTEGPSFTAEGEMARYEDVIRFESDDHRLFTSRCMGGDGKWHEVMTMSYRRIG